jgi:hypothetical protein
MSDTGGSHDNEKVYVIFSLKRSDLVAMGIPKERVDSLSDDDIGKIVADIRKLYQEADIQGAIELYTKMYLVFEKTE